MNATPKAQRPLTASFLVSTSVLTDPELNTYIPRAVRKTLRLSPAKRKTTHKTTHNATSERHTTLTDYFNTEYRVDAYHNQNLIDPEPYADEFGDIDNEYEGLTITEPMNEVELFEFCTGYNVI